MRKILLLLWFCISSLSGIAQVSHHIQWGEIYIGQFDLGAGNGIPLLVLDGNYNDAIEQVLNDNVNVNVSGGSLLLNVRLKDASNNWGPVFKKALVYTPIVNGTPRDIKITSGEIYMGQFDPGAGNGIPFLVFDGNYNDAIEQVLNDNVNVNVTGGSLLLNVRLKDASNNWGPVFKKAWVYTPIVNGTPRDIKITAGELYMGQFDPGAGNGIPFLVFDGNYNDAIEQVLNDNVNVNVTGGSLLLNVRLKDASNNWGPVFKKAWVYTPIVNGTPRDIKITAGEIYTGQFDPSAGNGIPFIVFDGNYNDAIEQVLNDNVNVNVSGGSLLLNVRLKDASNNWGPVFKKSWVYTPVINGTPRDIKITAGELYMGQFDPGAGNVIPFLVFDGNYNDAIEQVLNDNVNINVSGGSLLLNVRLKDASNNWGPVFKKAWVYTPIVNGTPRDIKITAGELYIGQFDPGAGNGIPFLVFDGNYNDAIEQVLNDNVGVNISGGSLLLNVRLKDASNNWGPVFKKAWVYTPVVNGTPRDIKITAGELYMGQFDPGAGNGIPFLVFDGNYNDAIEQVLNDNVNINVSGGSLLLNVRLKDASNNWGPVFKKAWVYTPIVNGTPRDIKITAGELYIGQFDPGAGNGIPFLVFDGNYNDAIEQVLNDNVGVNISGGSLLLNVRLKDASNNWGPVFKKAWMYAPVVNGTPRDIKITAGEYFFGQFDPGLGNATPISASDGSFNDAIESVLRTWLTWNTTASPSLFNIRLRDASQQWGPVFRKVIFPSGANNTVNLIAEGDSIKLCAGNAITLHYSGPNGYTIHWFNNTQQDSVQFTPTVPGYYAVQAQLGNSIYTDSIYVSFYANPQATISPSGNVMVCGNGTFYLTSTALPNTNYQWYYNGSAISGATSATYLPTQLGVYKVRTINTITGCLSYSDTTRLYLSPQIQTTVNTINCSQTYILSIGAGSGHTYQWKLNGTIISGATQSTYTPTVSGSYSVFVSNSNCNATTAAVNITIVPPITASITASGATTFCQGGSVVLSTPIVNGQTYQWYLGSNLIPGATQNNYTATLTGSYSVRVSNSQNCTANSNAIQVQVYPTPTVGALSNVSYCNGQNVAAVPLQGTPANVSFSISGGALRGLANQTNVTAIPSFTATSAGSSVVTILPNANGCSGASSTYTLSVSNCPPVSVNLKFYISGYYVGGGFMTTVLYNEGEITDPNSPNCDYVIVELHNVTPPYSMAKSTLAILKTNGTLQCSFPGSVSNTPYYIVIKHRNSVGTWSANPVTIVPNLLYDFSNAISKVYGDNQMQVDAGIWSIYNGDINQDENIDLLDITELTTDITNFNFGYLPTDLNGDGNVDLLDDSYLDPMMPMYIFSTHP